VSKRDRLSPLQRVERAIELDQGGYTDLFERAQRKAGCESWELVSEDALRDVLEETDNLDLLTDGWLAREDDWRRVDLSSEGEPPDIRWYYVSGDEPRVDEFRRFHDLLTAHAPDGYEPHYFRVEPAGKAPALSHGSWKGEENRLTVEEAVEWMQKGGNIGIAGTADDPLVNIDVDDGEATTPDDIPDTLRARSRSRTGQHYWGFNPEGDIPNLPTDELGEVRTDWQYVVAPGSFCASASEEIPDGAEDPGYYTVEHEAPVATISYDDLPKAFREWEEQQAEEQEKVEEQEGVGEPASDTPVTGESGPSKSALFNVSAGDLIGGSKDPSERWTSLFHGSDTSANMSISREGKLQCWRHNVAHGGLQALAVQSKHSPSGDTACRQIGKAHKRSNAGKNAYKGDWRLIWWAWDAAKQRGHIPSDDPIPYRALINIAVRDGLLDEDDLVERENESGGSYLGFPDATSYNAALEHIQQEYGHDPGREPTRPSSKGDDILWHVLEDRESFDSIDNAVCPDNKSFVLLKPPREGGSHWTMQQFKDDEFAVVASKHSILKQHLETLGDILESNQCAVHYKGRRRVCDHPDEDPCPKNPGSDPEKRHGFQNEVKDILHRKQAITAEDAPDHICSHWFLQQAAQQAHVVCTVPQLLMSIDREFEDMRCMMDEEQSLDPFRPDSVSLLSVHRTRETDGSVSIQQGERPLTDQVKVLRKIMDDVREEQERRKEEAKEEGRGWRRKTGEILVEEGLEAAEEMLDALGTGEIIDDLRDANAKLTLSNVRDAMKHRLEDIEFPETSASKDSVYESLQEWCSPYFWNEEGNPFPLLEAMTFEYDKRRFDFKRTGGNQLTLRLIGDGEQEPYYADELSEFKQHAVIAGPEGERFLDDLDCGAKAIEIEEFRYADSYIVVPFGKEDDDGDMESVAKQRDRVRQAATKLNERRTPQIAVTGTKAQADALDADLSTETADVIGSPESPTIDLYSLWTIGGTAVIYENSIVARGIDAPHYDITSITSTGFATPYWEAKKNHWRDRDFDEYREAQAVEAELVRREVTNAAVRTAPTRYLEGYFGTKFILIAQSDVRKLKYLHDRALPPFESARRGVNVIDQLTVGGGLQTTINDIYRTLGESEKELVKTLTEEELCETGRDRPSYTKTEVEKWVSSYIITQRETCDTVESVIARRMKDPTTQDIHDALPTFDHEKTRAALEILERKGVIRSYTESDGTVGRPVKYWEVI